MYIPLTSSSSSASSSSSVFSLPSLRHMAADPGYDDRKLYEYSRKALGMDLVCPVERYKNTPKRGLSLCAFINLDWDSPSATREGDIYRAIDRTHQVSLGIDPLPVRGFHAVSAVVLLSVLLYQIMVCYSCKTGKLNPKSIKYVLGTY